jgi:hypothetical protein
MCVYSVKDAEWFYFEETIDHFRSLRPFETRDMEPSYVPATPDWEARLIVMSSSLPDENSFEDRSKTDAAGARFTHALSKVLVESKSSIVSAYDIAHRAIAAVRKNCNLPFTR